METRELGRSGISVSRIVLGCGNFGGVGSAPAFFGQGIPHDEAPRIMDAAWELGITTFDTADAYGGGRSETWIGEWLAAKDSEVRDAITIETKTFNPMGEGEDRGLSRQRIRRQIESSLERLGIERIPLYMAHAPDPDTPVEETLAAFDELVRAGTVGAVGASNYTAEQLAEAVEISELEGLTRYEWVQNSFSLLERDDADTVFPVCREHGLGYEVHSPHRRRLARGPLSARPGVPGRLANDAASRWLPPVRDRRDRSTRSRPSSAKRSDEAYRWRDSLSRGCWTCPEVTAVVVGPTRAEQLEPVREALALELSAEEHVHLGGLFP